METGQEQCRASCLTQAMKNIVINMLNHSFDTKVRIRGHNRDEPQGLAGQMIGLLIYKKYAPISLENTNGYRLLHNNIPFKAR